MAIHILTSAKGGVGKTLCALSLIHYYNTRKQSVVAIDLNSTNPDFSRILAQAQGESSLLRKQALPTEVFQISESKSEDKLDAYLWQFSGMGINNAVGRPANPFYMALGSAGFWERLRQITAHTESILAGSPIIIDTNLHPANLLASKGGGLRGPAIPEIRRSLSSIRKLRRNPSERVYLWFIWTFSVMPPRLPSEADVVAGRLQPQQLDTDQIIRVSDFFKEQLGEDFQMVHVLNPYSLYPPFTLDRLARDTIDLVLGKDVFDFLIKPLHELKMQNSVESIDTNRFINVLENSMQSLILHSYNEESLFQPIGKGVIEASSDIPEKRGRPKNVFPISIYSKDLVHCIDSFVMEAELSYNDVMNQISDFREELSGYLEILET